MTSKEWLKFTFTKFVIRIIYEAENPNKLNILLTMSIIFSLY